MANSNYWLDISVKTKSLNIEVKLERPNFGVWFLWFLVIVCLVFFVKSMNQVRDGTKHWSENGYWHNDSERVSLLGTVLCSHRECEAPVSQIEKPDWIPCGGADDYEGGISHWRGIEMETE